MSAISTVLNLPWTYYSIAHLNPDLVSDNKISELAKLIFARIGITKQFTFPSSLPVTNAIPAEFSTALCHEIQREREIFKNKLYRQIANGKYHDKSVIDIQKNEAGLDPTHYYTQKLNGLFKQHPFPLQLINLFYWEGVLSDFHDTYKEYNLLPWLIEELHLITLLQRILSSKVKTISRSGDELTFTYKGSEKTDKHSIQKLAVFLSSQGALCTQKRVAEELDEKRNLEDLAIQRNEESDDIEFISWHQIIIEWSLNTSSVAIQETNQLLIHLDFPPLKNPNTTDKSINFHDYLIERSYNSLLTTLKITFFPPRLESLLKKFWKENEYPRKMMLIGLTNQFRTSPSWQTIVKSSPEIQSLDRYLRVHETVNRDDHLAVQLYDHLLTEEEFITFQQAIPKFPHLNPYPNHPSVKFLIELNEYLLLGAEYESEKISRLVEIKTLEDFLKIADLFESENDWSTTLFNLVISEMECKGALNAIHDTLLIDLTISDSLRASIQSINHLIENDPALEPIKHSLPSLQTVADFLQFDTLIGEEDQLETVLENAHIDFKSVTTAFQQIPLRLENESVKALNTQLMHKVRTLHSLSQVTPLLNSYENYLELKNFIQAHQGLREIFFQILDKNEMMSLAWDKLEVYFRQQAIHYLKHHIKDLKQIF